MSLPQLVCRPIAALKTWPQAVRLWQAGRGIRHTRAICCLMSAHGLPDQLSALCRLCMGAIQGCACRLAIHRGPDGRLSRPLTCLSLAGRFDRCFAGRVGAWLHLKPCLRTGTPGAVTEIAACLCPSCCQSRHMHNGKPNSGRHQIRGVQCSVFFNAGPSMLCGCFSMLDGVNWLLC